MIPPGFMGFVDGEPHFFPIAPMVDPFCSYWWKHEVEIVSVSHAPGLSWGICMPFVKDFLFIAEPRPVGFTMFHFLFLFKHAMLSECAAALDGRVHRAQEPNRTSPY